MVIRNLLLTIKSNIKAFLSIICLTFLGVSFFIGMKISVPDLKSTIDDYYEKSNYMDLDISTPVGINNDEIAKIKKEIIEIENLEGVYTKDVVVDGKKRQLVVRLHSLKNNDGLNKIMVLGGRLPNKNDEIAIETNMFNKQGYNIGDKIVINGVDDLLKEKELTIVGHIKSPLYISTNKGSTNLLSGKVDYYAYLYYDNVKSEIFSNIYIKLKDNFKDSNIDSIKSKVNSIISTRYLDLVNDYEKDINESERKLNEAKERYTKEFTEYEEKIANVELELQSAVINIPTKQEIENQIAAKKNELNKVKNQLDIAKQRLDESNMEYNNSVSSFNESAAQLKKTKKETDDAKNDYNNQISRLQGDNLSLKQELSNTNNPIRISEINKQISDNNEKISNLQNAVSFIQSLISVAEYELNIYKEQLDNAKVELKAAQEEYDVNYNEYVRLNNIVANISPETIIKEYKKQIAEKRVELEKKKKELYENKSKLEKDLEKYQLQVDDAKDYFYYISNSNIKITSKENAQGYSQYISDINRVDKLGNFFPVIFFVVVVLMTITTITRMIDKDRIEIGILKSLGYSGRQIRNKYVLYALFSSLIGGILGSFFGFLIIPKIIYRIYKVLYFLPELTLNLDFKILLAANFIIIFLVVISAYLLCKSVLKELPVLLLRPKQEKNCKINFIEKNSGMWNKLSFNAHVTIRNLFKYKRRFIMTICGVSGCVALIIVGFNLRSSISNIIPLQYGDIFKIDVQTFFKNSVTRVSAYEEQQRIDGLEEVSSSMLIGMKNVNINDTAYKTFLIVPNDNDQISDYVKLKKGKEIYTLEDDGAIITEKISILLDIKVGDSIAVKDSDGNFYNIKIKHICDNYVDNYLYLSKEYYNNLSNNSIKYNSLLIKTEKNVSEEKLSEKINANNQISYLTYSSSAKIAYNNILKSLNSISYLLVISAIILSFIVLYNLTCLNIDERRREIATIKVLGFNKKELNHYIENEVKLLTIIGILVGIVLGCIFAKVIIKNCELDNLMYDYSIVIVNYLYAIILTIIFMSFTCVLSRKQIKKINMIESLKQIE